MQRANLEGLGVRKEHKLEVKNKEEEAKDVQAKIALFPEAPERYA